VPKLTPMQQVNASSDLSIPSFLKRKAGDKPSPIVRPAGSALKPAASTQDNDDISRPWRKLFPQHANDEFVRQILTKGAQTPSAGRLAVSQPAGDRPSAASKSTPVGVRLKAGDRLAKANKPKPDKAGLIGVATIAESLGVTAKEARTALRASKAVKPEGGWAWPADKAKAMTAIIKANLKKKGGK
jgi:hypothetical protein